MNIGRNILYFRQQQGLTQQQLADVLGINKMAISNYEKGKRQPSIETLKAISKALGISLMQFMAYSEGVELSAGHFQNTDLLTAAQKESIEAQIRYVYRTMQNSLLQLWVSTDYWRLFCACCESWPKNNEEDDTVAICPMGWQRLLRFAAR